MGDTTAREEEEMERLLDEGYRATSRDNLEFAERAIPLGWEVIELDDADVSVRAVAPDVMDENQPPPPRYPASRQ
jgi:hypothetical protein